MEDVEWFDHRSAPLTVGQLRAALAGLDDDLPVMVVAPRDPGGSASVVIDVAGAEVRRGRLHLQASWPTGRYQRPRTATLTVAGLPADGSPESEESIAALLAAVRDATGADRGTARDDATGADRGTARDDATGAGQAAGADRATEPGRAGRGAGESSMTRDGDTVTWTWHAGGAPVDALMEVAAERVRGLNPGTWDVRNG